MRGLSLDENVDNYGSRRDGNVVGERVQKLTILTRVRRFLFVDTTLISTAAEV